MLDDVLHTRVLSDTAHAHTMGVIAPQVLHKDVGRVGLGREAIIPNVDTGVGDAESVDVERIKAVGVFGQSLWKAWSVYILLYGTRDNYRGIGRESIDEDVVEGDVVGAHEEVCPAWRVQLGDALHADASCVVGQEQNWPVEGVARVLEYC
jgi:hypothetical protein